MQEDNNTPAPAIVPNISEPNAGAEEIVRKRSEEKVEEFRTSSEPFRTNTETFGSVPNESAFRSEDVRNGSERDIDNAIRDVHEEGDFRTAPTCSEAHTEFTITVREAARIFEEAGVPRTERAVTNWCNRNARGVTRLDCCYHEGERKYYITPESIQRIIGEERKKMQYIEYREGQVFSEQAEQLAEEVRNGSEQPGPTSETEQSGSQHTRSFETPPVATPHNQDQTEQGGFEKKQNAERHVLTDAERDELRELKMENFNLKVQLEGQKYLVRQFDTLVDGERERHEREKLALIDRLTDARHQIGSLEQQLLQLEAPKRDRVQDVEAEPSTRRINSEHYSETAAHTYNAQRDHNASAKATPGEVSYSQ